MSRSSEEQCALCDGYAMPESMCVGNGVPSRHRNPKSDRKVTVSLGLKE